MDEQPLPASGAAPAPSPARALAVYSLLRLGLLAACYLVLRLVLGSDASPLLVVGAAVLTSALLSLVLLKRQRDAFAEASIVRADRRREERAARQARLDGAGDTEDRPTQA